MYDDRHFEEINKYGEALTAIEDRIDAEQDIEKKLELYWQYRVSSKNYLVIFMENIKSIIENLRK